MTEVLIEKNKCQSFGDSHYKGGSRLSNRTITYACRDRITEICFDFHPQHRSMCMGNNRPRKEREQTVGCDQMAWINYGLRRIMIVDMGLGKHRRWIIMTMTTSKQQ